MEREALKLALDALGKAKRQIVHAKVAPHECIGEAITAIKKALAQPAQEPVGKVTENTDNGFKCEFNQRLTAGTKLYTSPQRPWVGLTDEEIQPRLNGLPTQSIAVYARNIEAILKEKNNGT